MLELFNIALRYEGIVFPEKHCALGLWHPWLRNFTWSRIGPGARLLYLCPKGTPKASTSYANNILQITSFPLSGAQIVEQFATKSFRVGLCKRNLQQMSLSSTFDCSCALCKWMFIISFLFLVLYFKYSPEIDFSLISAICIQRRLRSLR